MVLLRNILTGIPLAIILILVLSADTDWVSKYGGLVVGLVAVAWAVWLGLKYLGWRMTYFVVTSRRVIYRSGVISKRGVEIPLERINNINFHQRLIDRIIGAGDLDIESAGKDGQSHFDFIRHPDGVQHEIYRQMEARNMPVAMVQQAPAVVRPGAARRRPCPSRSSSWPACATRATSPTPSSKPRRRSCSAACEAIASGDPPRAVDGAGDEAHRVDAGGGAVAECRLRQHVVGVVALRECDDAAAEPGAGESGAGRAARRRAARPTCRARGSTRRSRRAGWRGSRARSGPSTDRSPRERVGGGQDARVLGDDVPRTREVAHLLGVASRSAVSPSEAATASHSARRIAYSDPASVRGTPQCTTSTASDGGIAIGVTVVCAAVDQQRVTRPSEQGRELVHQPTGHAGRERLRGGRGARRARSGRAHRRRGRG